jgi:dUTP pyrophosphatase
MKCKRLDSDAKLPTRKHITDAGIDVYALHDEMILPQSCKVIRTGITFEFPKDTVAHPWPKSRNDYLIGAGVIDCDYQGEILIKIVNPYNKLIKISKHEGIAQLVIYPIVRQIIEEVDEIHEIVSDRGETGGIAGNAKSDT